MNTVISGGKRPLVAAYYFPNFHADGRNAQVHGDGWTEWELVKHAAPRFPGHRQPFEPLWGYEDEADPAVMARKIDAAADHGVDCFLFDWYYYDDGPFLERCLDEGFLGAANNHRTQFALMWANHDWYNIHPAKRSERRPLLYPGLVSPDTFEKIGDTVIERYFSHPSHLDVEGAPFFSIYNVPLLVKSHGDSLEKTREALERFRRKTVAAGFPGLHLNAIAWNCGLLQGEADSGFRMEDYARLGFDSIGGYVWGHYIRMSDIGEAACRYPQVRDAYLDAYRTMKSQTALPVFPNVTMGWDSTPRTVQSDMWSPTVGYPFTSLMETSPREFREALSQALAHAQQQDGFSMVSLNAWNEWTEGSYLEPDKLNGWAYLEAVRSVFGIEPSRPVFSEAP